MLTISSINSTNLSCTGICQCFLTTICDCKICCVYSYVDFYKLSEPCDDIHTVLDSISKRIGALTKGIGYANYRASKIFDNFVGGIYDHQRSARHILKMYRDGKLGTMTLDTNC